MVCVSRWAWKLVSLYDGCIISKLKVFVLSHDLQNLYLTKCQISSRSTFPGLYVTVINLTSLICYKKVHSHLIIIILILLLLLIIIMIIIIRRRIARSRIWACSGNFKVNPGFFASQRQLASWYITMVTWWRPNQHTFIQHFWCFGHQISCHLPNKAIN